MKSVTFFNGSLGAQSALLLIDGCTHEEIARQVGCARRTVLRKIELLKAELAAGATGAA